MEKPLFEPRYVLLKNALLRPVDPGRTLNDVHVTRVTRKVNLVWRSALRVMRHDRTVAPSSGLLTSHATVIFANYYQGV